MTVTFIGHGYVGLVTACVFADFGNNVYVIGHTHEKISKLNNGDSLIYEPGLKELLQKNLKAGRIKFSTEYKNAISNSDIVFIAVGTPMDTYGNADLKNVFDVSKKIGKYLKKGFTVVCCKSTVPIGTNLRIAQIINKNKSKDSDFAIASCPEFLREGTAISDSFNPDRIVIGSNSKKALDLLIELHKPLNGKRIITSLQSAELIKYASNSMLAIKISFANFISFLAEETKADVRTILDAVGLDKRIGMAFLNPGIGYGGSCLPKDVSALINISKKMKIDPALLTSASLINVEARERFCKKILKKIKPGSTITIWGLSFKPNTDDIREAPSIYIVNKLIKHKIKLQVYDPVAMNNFKLIFGSRVVYYKNPYEALKNSDALCILTEWNEFKEVDLTKIKTLLRRPVIFDGRNIYKTQKMKNIGFDYQGIGNNIL
jgi:UDPglucose 6-dehydrogenase